MPIKEILKIQLIQKQKKATKEEQEHKADRTNIK